MQCFVHMLVQHVCRFLIVYACVCVCMCEESKLCMCILACMQASATACILCVN